MRRSHIYRLSIALTLILALALLWARTTARSQGDYDLSWGTLTGGGTSSGGDYTMDATAAQPEVSLAASEGDYTVVGGVWGSPIAPTLVYLPLVLRTN
jgi:hypothetical protein